MTIAVDFDGLLHDGEWPGIGRPKPGALRAMRRLKADGHYLIVWSCRRGRAEGDMEEWLRAWGFPHDSINASRPEHIIEFFGDTRKVYADVYVDDRQVGGLPSWDEIYDLISGKIKLAWHYELL